MKSLIFKSIIFLTSAFSFLAISSCLKGDFDTPPTSSNDPEISADQIVNLSDIKTKYYVPGKYTLIEEDKYIKCVVVADDKSGNYYKTIILEDENSDHGIAVLIDENDIHSTYPVGRRVFLYLKGLTISDYNNLPQIGLGVDNSGSSARLGSIPGSLMEKVLLPGSFGVKVTPRVKKISELTANDYNTLVQLDDVEFVNVGSNVTYASIQPIASVNHDLVDCNNEKIIVRNSGYADFANLVLPSKNGRLLGIYSVFRTDKQLFIRDTSDVAFTKNRCDGGGGGTGDLIRIQDLRAKYTGTETSISSGYVQAVVISDITNKNINGQNMVVQDGDYGITLRFKSPINVPLGTEVKVNLAGGKLGEFRNLLQVSDLTNTNVEILGNKTVTPRQLTVSQLDITKYESTLVKIKDVTLSGGTKYSDKIKVKDITGEIDMFTFESSTFGSSPIANGPVTITAILSDFDPNKQLNIRNLNDIEGGGPCDVNNAAADCDGDGVANGQDCAPSDKLKFQGGPCDDGNAATVNDKYDDQCICKGSVPGNGFDENFSSQTNNQDINLQNWINVATKGTRKWQGKVFSGNTYAQATAFNDSAPDMETWLITPVINTSNSGTMSFETAKAFWVHDGLTVWVTSNYTGDPATTSWIKLTAKVAVNADADNAFIPSGNIDLKPFGANVRVGFKYEGKGGTNTSTFRIDNVKVN